MEDVVLVSGCRTAIGRFQGSLADVPASDLAATVIREAVNRAGIQPEHVDHVVMGIVGQVAEDAYLSRHAAVKAGLPIGTPAMNVNRICGSGLEAINTASRLILAGDAQVVVAGGAENMSRMPYYLRKARFGYRLGHDAIEDGIIHMLTDPFHGYHMGITAENLAERFEISREAQDALAAESQRRALNAIEKGYFKSQIVPIKVRVGREEKVFDTDEHPRPTDEATLAKLRPAFKEGGMVTAGNASGINDGAAAVVVMSATRAKELGVTPKLRIVARAEAGVDPAIMGSGPIPAIRKALEKAQLSLDQIDCIELNEAFASVAC
ncbi:MAG: acetyl-CoA C-acyltransferase, partial [Dehalococcoidia bacterium]|nr:acetyl-CoA C-acyltransferase [Dehalococcoidia bacterium]